MNYFIRKRKILIGYVILLLVSCILGVYVTPDSFLISILSAIALLVNIQKCFKRVHSRLMKYEGLTEQLAYIWIQGDKVMDKSVKAVKIGFEYTPTNIASKFLKLHNIEYAIHTILFEESAVYLLTPIREESYTKMKEMYKTINSKYLNLSYAFKELKIEHATTVKTKDKALDQIESFIHLHKDLNSKLKEAITSFKKIKTRNKTVLPLLEQLKEKIELYI